VSALERAGATVVETLSHAFPGAGLTSVLILRESHAVLHTWPETGTVNIDIFSCSTRLKSLEAVDELSRCLGARQVSVHEVPRADGHSPGSRLQATAAR
jgi:S-adenosylmethionine decarboxylase